MWGEGPVPPDQMLRDVDHAVPVLERAGDHAALAMAELVRFFALDRARLPTEQRLSVALDHARKANEREIEHRVMSWMCITLPGRRCSAAFSARPYFANTSASVMCSVMKSRSSPPSS